MRARIAILVLFLLLALDGLAATAADWRISRVTVHPDRAEVVRVARVHVSAGTSDVVFGDIPIDVDEDSLRASGRGDAFAIGAVEVRTDVHEAPLVVDHSAARAEVRRLEAELARLTAEEATDRDLRKYLDSLREAAARGRDTDDALAPDPAALLRMLAFLRTGYAELAEAELKRQARRAAVTDELPLARARLAAVQGPGAVETVSAEVQVIADVAGAVELSLTYVLAGASWRPTYRASLDVEKSEIELVSEAVVTQITGEDWSDVSLRLSTSDPSESLEPPVLVSARIGSSPPAQANHRLNGASINDRLLPGARFDVPTAAIAQFELITTGDSAEYGEQSSGMAGVVTTEVLRTAHDVEFVVPGASDVASDGAEHRVTLRRGTMPVELEYRIVPSKQAATFALAIGHAPEDRPLLSGPVRVMAGGALVGEFMLPETPAQGEVRIPFGVDNRIQVKRTAPTRVASQESGNRKQVSLSFRTRIENLRDVPVIVTLEESVPVSGDEQVVVKLGSETTQGYRELEGRPGLLAWELELAPKEKREVTLAYVVRHPEDVVVAGL